MAAPEQHDCFVGAFGRNDGELLDLYEPDTLPRPARMLQLWRPCAAHIAEVELTFAHMPMLVRSVCQLTASWALFFAWIKSFVFAVYNVHPDHFRLDVLGAANCSGNADAAPGACIAAQVRNIKLP